MFAIRTLHFKQKHKLNCMKLSLLSKFDMGTESDPSRLGQMMYRIRIGRSRRLTWLFLVSVAKTDSITTHRTHIRLHGLHHSFWLQNWYRIISLQAH